MDRPLRRRLGLLSDWSARLHGPVPIETEAASRMDRPRPRQPAWRRYGPLALGGGAALLAAIWLASALGGHGYRAPADRLTIATVTEGAFEDFAAVRGAVAPFATHYLTTGDGGAVQQVLVEDGAIVAAGQPLVVFGNSNLQFQIASREAEAASQINALENTQLQLEETRFRYQRDLLTVEHQISDLKAALARDKILLDGNAIAPSTYRKEEEEYAFNLRLRDATLASKSAEQSVRTRQLKQLQETLQRLRSNMTAAKASLDGLTVRAPVAGQLTALDAEVGQSKPAGAVVGQIDSQDRFKLTAKVDEFYLARVAVGQDALFTLEGRDYRARVGKIYPQISSGVFKVDLDFVGAPPPGIHNGEAVDLKIELGGAARARILPNGPFYQDTGGNWVFVVTPDGHSARRRAVRLGRRNPQFVEVIDGLRPGERVIVSNYDAFAKSDRLDIGGSAARH